MEIQEKALCLSAPLRSFTATPPVKWTLTCHVTTARAPYSSEAGPLRDSADDRRIGLNMNYSIIFTEISFSPETSILLQIIQIIHMTVGIIQNPTEKGRAVCQFWLPGGKHNVTPTDKNYHQARVTLGTT